MTEHEDRPRDLQRDGDDMEERSERLEDEIDDAREDWERKKADSSVPGAAGDPEKAEAGPQPETSYPSKGDEEDL
jgi:predicted  nucleic acid-binding Zn-ribbon protein